MKILAMSSDTLIMAKCRSYNIHKYIDISKIQCVAGIADVADLACGHYSNG